MSAEIHKPDHLNQGGGVGYFELFGPPNEHKKSTEEHQKLIASAIATAALSLEREKARKCAAEGLGYPVDYNPWQRRKPTD